MSTLNRGSWFCLAILLTAVSPVGAQWTEVGPGIEYREFSVSGPNRVFVTRMAVNNQSCIIESSIGSGYLRTGRETVTGMANRYQDAVNYWDQNWGNRNQVVAAINGSYFNVNTGEPFGGVIHSGSYDKRHDNVSSESGFAWTLNRGAFIGECITHMDHKQLVTYANNNTQQFGGINHAPGTNQLTIFTPRYDTHTYTDNTVSEVLVQLERPFLLMPHPASVSGIVRQIRVNQGSTPLAFDHIVLSAKGTAATTMLNNVSVGDTIRFSQEIHSFMRDCATPRALDWTKTYAGISGNWRFLRDGVIQTDIDSSGAVHPRTAVALNDDYVFFVVVDGRQPGYSVGMSINQLAAFCKNSLEATWGVNQDGGGSSALWLNGQIKNRPSDGTERAVANGLMMVVVQPKQQSTVLRTDDTVRTNATTTVRLGPGTNYGLTGGSIPSMSTGTVLAHPMNGVRGTGKTWWYCQIGGVTGWFDAAVLSLTSRRVPDFDGDGDVDQDDFGYLQKCLTGSAVPQNDPACTDARLDDDEDVDAQDLAIFQACFSGPGEDYSPGCAD